MRIETGERSADGAGVSGERPDDLGRVGERDEADAPGVADGVEQAPAGRRGRGDGRACHRARGVDGEHEIGRAHRPGLVDALDEGKPAAEVGFDIGRAEITRGLHDHAHGMGSRRLDARHLGGRRGAESGRSRECRGEQCQGRRAAGAAGDHAVLRSLPRRSTSTFAVVSPKNDFGSVTPCCSSLSSKPGRMPVWRIFDVTCSPPASSTNEATNRS